MWLISVFYVFYISRRQGTRELFRVYLPLVDDRWFGFRRQILIWRFVPKAFGIEELVKFRVLSFEFRVSGSGDDSIIPTLAQLVPNLSGLAYYHIGTFWLSLLFYLLSFVFYLLSWFLALDSEIRDSRFEDLKIWKFCTSDVILN